MKAFFKSAPAALAIPVGLIVFALVLYTAPSSVVLEAQVPSNWTVYHAPAADTKATISKAAVTGSVYVADCVSAFFAAGASAPTAVTVNVTLRDGATGAGTVVKQWPMSVPATAGANAPPVTLCGLEVRGTISTAMTIEFAAAGGANTIEAVWLQGHTIK